MNAARGRNSLETNLYVQDISTCSESRLYGAYQRRTCKLRNVHCVGSAGSIGIAKAVHCRMRVGGSDRDYGLVQQGSSIPMERRDICGRQMLIYVTQKPAELRRGGDVNRQAAGAEMQINPTGSHVFDYN